MASAQRSWSNSTSDAFDPFDSVTALAAAPYSYSCVDPPPESVFDVPFPRHEDYIDRGDALQELEASLERNKTALGCRPVILSGFRGPGHTQAALEYCYRSSDNYAYVFWLDASNAGSIYTSFTRAASLLNLSTGDIAAVEAIKSYFSDANMKWLLVFDNVGEDPGAFGEMLRLISQFTSVVGGDILVTLANNIANLRAFFINVGEKPTSSPLPPLPQAAGIVSPPTSNRSDSSQKTFVSPNASYSALPLLKDQQHIAPSSTDLSSLEAAYPYDIVASSECTKLSRALRDRLKLSKMILDSTSLKRIHHEKGSFFVDSGTDRLGGTASEFMKAVSAIFPILIEQYPEYANAILRRVAYVEIPFIKVARSKDEKGKDRPLQAIRFLSTFPENYGLIGFNREAELSWRTTPFHKLYFQRRITDIKQRRTLCVVPLRGICPFVEYEDQPGVISNKITLRDNNIWRPHSPFTDIVNSINNEEFFEADFWGALLNFKWRWYAAFRFFQLWAIDTIFAALFAASAIPVSDQVTPWAAGMQTTVIALGLLFLLHEIRQFIYEGWHYWADIYNYIDIITYSLPVIVSALNIFGVEYSQKNQPTALAIIFLWCHFLQQCRVFSQIGIFANVVIGGVREILPFLFIIVVINLAFGHGLYALLSDYSGVSADQNRFNSFLTSLKNVYYTWTGDASGLQAFDGDFFLVDLLRMALTFLLAIYMLNLLIAVLNDRFSTAVQRSKAAHRYQMARLIAEIEVFWMLPHERTDPRLFPHDIFFEVSPSVIKEWRHKYPEKDIIDIFLESSGSLESE